MHGSLQPVRLVRLNHWAAETDADLDLNPVRCFSRCTINAVYDRNRFDGLEELVQLSRTLVMLLT
jgi:hypothetical protein